MEDPVEWMATIKGRLASTTDVELWAEALRRGLIEMDGTGYASKTAATPAGDDWLEVFAQSHIIPAR